MAELATRYDLDALRRELETKIEAGSEPPREGDELPEGWLEEGRREQRLSRPPMSTQGSAPPHPRPRGKFCMGSA